MIRPLSCFIVTACIFANTLPLSAAVIEGNHVVVAYGKETGPRGRVLFTKNRGALESLRIETIEAGREGSKLTVSIDKDTKPVFEHVFTAGECTTENGKNRCAFSLKGRGADYGRVLAGFRRGTVSRIGVETKGAMEMSQETLLAGFTKVMPKTKK